MDRSIALDELKQGLRDLLSLLDGNEPSTDLLLRAVSDCDVRMAALKRQPVPADESAQEQREFAESMEEALRLNSVARGIVESHGRSLIAQLEKARGLRRGLSAHHSGGGGGRSVDVAG